MFRTRTTLIALLALAPFGGCAGTMSGKLLDVENIESFRPAGRTEVAIDLSQDDDVDIAPTLGLVVDTDEASGNARGARGGAQLTTRSAGLRGGAALGENLTVDAVIGLGISQLDGQRIQDVEGGAGISSAGLMVGGSVRYALSPRMRVAGQVKRVQGAGGGFATSVTTADICVEIEPFENTAILAGWRAMRFDAEQADNGAGLGMVVTGPIFGIDWSF